MTVSGAQSPKLSALGWGGSQQYAFGSESSHLPEHLPLKTPASQELVSASLWCKVAPQEQEMVFLSLAVATWQGAILRSLACSFALCSFSPRKTQVQPIVLPRGQVAKGNPKENRTEYRHPQA